MTINASEDYLKNVFGSNMNRKIVAPIPSIDSDDDESIEDVYDLRTRNKHGSNQNPQPSTIVPSQPEDVPPPSSTSDYHNKMLDEIENDDTVDTTKKGGRFWYIFSLLVLFVFVSVVIAIIVYLFYYKGTLSLNTVPLIGTTVPNNRRAVRRVSRCCS